MFVYELKTDDMEALEYLLKNIAIKYSYFPGILGCRSYIDNKGYHIFEYLNSNSIDGAILRGWNRFSLYLNSHYRAIHTIEMYIQNEVMLRMLNNAEFPQTKTELVKLKIAVNKIFSLTFLPAEDKIWWSEWVKELYWERKKVLHQWYLENILPF